MIRTPGLLHAMACLALASLPLIASVEAQDRSRSRIRIERAADLPPRSYRISGRLEALLDDSAQFNAIARQLEADLLSTLNRYEIADRPTLKQYYGTLSNLALLRGEYDLAVRWQDSIRAIEDKPALRVLAGLLERPLAETSRAPRERLEESFRDAFRRELSALPFAEVRTELIAMKQYAELGGTPGARSLAQQMLSQHVRDSVLTMAGAQLLVQMRAGFDERRMRLGRIIIATLDEVITANTAVAKPNIWAARDASLEGRRDLTPTVIAIWDSGVDVELFAGRLFVNTKEVPGNGRDDDNNGFVDDVNGIAHDLNHDRRTGVLAPNGPSAEQRATYVANMRGDHDMRSGVDSPEARALKQKLSSMPGTEAFAWFQGMTAFHEFIHGTHVAAIAMANNPAARLLVARNEEDNWKMKPQLVTMAGERKRAAEYRATVEYFRRNGVRVVNMSWAFTPGYYTDILARNQVGDTATRRQMAREMFDTAATALRGAMESAPEILFVTGAGNRNDDGRFVERVPAIWDLPNLITVAATDHAGDEAPFTSFGKVDVHANGSEIESVAPGGAKVPWSGTSMAAPQVVNLAAKLLALRPSLTIAELKNVIVATAHVKPITDRKTLRLLNPMAAVDRILAMPARR